MTGKTLIICYKPSIMRYLTKTICDEFTDNGYYYEGLFYIVTMAHIESDADWVFLPFKQTRPKDLKNSLSFLYQTEPEVINGGPRRVDYVRRLEELINRDDVKEVIWYSSYDHPYLILLDQYYRATGSSKRSWLCFEECIKDDVYLPVKGYKTEKLMKRYFSAARVSNIRDGIISAYLTKIIELIYNKKYPGYSYRTLESIDDFDALYIKRVYESPNREFNYGSLFVDMENTQFRLPFLYQIFPTRYFKNAHGTIHNLSDSGYIYIESKTGRICHTDKGKRVYEIIKEFVPEFMDEKKFFYWRRRLDLIINGKISEEDYISEVKYYVKDIVKTLYIEIR